MVGVDDDKPVKGHAPRVSICCFEGLAHRAVF